MRMDEGANEVHVDRSIPLDRADDLLHDDPVPVDYKALRNSGGLVEVLNVAALILQDREGQAERPGKRRDPARVSLVDAYRHDPEGGIRHQVVQTLDGRHLDPAGLAPRGPDVDEQHLPPVIRDRSRPARGQIDGVKIRRLGSDSHERDLRQNLDHQRHHQNDGADGATDHPPALAGHVAPPQRRRSSLTCAPGSAAPKTACPATKVSAPAWWAPAMVSGPMPPSTSREMSRRLPDRSARAR